MALYDQHLHTWFSTDSETDPARNAKRAADLGLAGLTFTDHFDTHLSEWPVCRYSYPGLSRAVRRLRERFAGRLHVGLGIEVCYQPEQMDRIVAFLESHQFDLVILSVHWTSGRAMHLREHWEDWDIHAATAAYLNTVLEAARFAGRLASQGRRLFDVLGHLDMVKRYTQRFRDGFNIQDHAELVDQILQACLDSGLVPEVNTSALRQGLDEPMPADWIIRRYAQLGGQAMTLGSDAHQPEHVAAHFEHALTLLENNGISNLAVFQNRACRLEPL